MDEKRMKTAYGFVSYKILLIQLKILGAGMMLLAILEKVMDN